MRKSTTCTFCIYCLVAEASIDADTRLVIAHAINSSHVFVHARINGGSAWHNEAHGPGGFFSFLVGLCFMQHTVGAAATESHDMHCG